MPLLYLATGDGPLVVAPRGDRWRAHRPLDIRPASCIAIDPHRSERVFCGTTRDGVWRSDDVGASWRRVFEGVPHDRVTALTVSGTERSGGLGIAYLGTEPSAIFRSADGGETWQECKGLNGLPSSGEWSFPPRPQTHHVRWIAPDPHAPGRLFVAIEAGALVWSPDGGASWRDRVPGGPLDTHELATHPEVPGRLWSAAGDGFFQSDDAGDTWHRAEDGLQHRYCWSLALDPCDPGIAMLSATAGPRQAHSPNQAEAHLYRRTSDGDPWHEVRDGLPEPKGT